MKYTLVLALLVSVLALASAQWTDNCPVRSSWKSGCANSAKPIGTTYACTLPNGLTDAVSKLFPEGSSPDPALLDASTPVRLFIAGANAQMNITFINEGAGYRNVFGYFLFNQTTGLTGRFTVFPDCTYENQVSDACMRRGDTVQMPDPSGYFPQGVFLGFWIRQDGYNKPNNPYWYSFEDKTVPNQVFNSDGFSKHTAWVYLTDFNATLFGFEDLSLGDKDYNDVMFTFTIRGNVSLNEIPVYSGGLLQTCRVGLISAIDYLESQCYQWALLQPPSSAQCQGFIELPTGWMVAPNDNITQAVITNRGSTWSQSVPNGCLVVNDGTPSSPAPYAYTLTGAACAPESFVLVQYGTNARCFSTICANRILLRSEAKLATCGAVADTCSNNPPTRILSTKPSSYVPIPVWPTEYNVYMQKGTDQKQNLPVAVNVPSTPPIDVMILFDANGAFNNDINLLAQFVGAFASELTAAAQGFDIPNIGFATFTKPNSGSAYITINCALQLADTVSGCIDNVNLPGTSSGTVDILKGVMDLMNTANSQIGWRTTAYRFIMTITDNPYSSGDNQATDLAATEVSRNIVPVFYLPNPFSSTRNSYNSLAASLPLARVKTGTVRTNGNSLGDTRLSGWAANTARDLFRATYNKITFVPSGTTAQNSFIDTIPAVYDITGLTPLARIYTQNITVKYNTASAPDPMPTTYPLSYKVLGFSSPAGETVNIITNNPPSAPSAQFTATQNVIRSFNVPASDVDGNQITIKFTCTMPDATKATLRDSSTGQNITCNTAISSLALDFIPSRLFYGQVSFNYTANDGCDTSPVGTITFDVARVNIPPVAEDFTVHVPESSLSAVDQTFSFIGHISDDDDAVSTLRIRIDSPPSGTLGRVAYPSGTLVTSSPVDNRLFPAETKDARFIPFQYENGVNTIPYTVIDPSNAQSSAVVTVIVDPVNDPPTLTAPATVAGDFAGDPTVITFSISVGERDSGDIVRVEVVSGDIFAHQVTNAGNTAPKITSSITPNTVLVTGKAVSTTKPYGYTHTLEWRIDQPSATGTFTIQAFDDDNAGSNLQTIQLVQNAGAPPKISTIGYAAIGSTTPAPGTSNSYIVNEEVAAAIKVAGTDVDTLAGGGEWEFLSVIVNSLPNSGSLQIKTGASSFVDVTVGATYNSSNSATMQDGFASQSTIFQFQYTGDTNFFGDDSFTYTVQDTRDAIASPPDTVSITVANLNDPPTSNDVELYMDADTTAPVTGIQAVDPDPADTHFLNVTSLPYNPNNGDSRGTLRTPDGSNFIEIGTLYPKSGGWDLQYTPTPNECSSWTITPLPKYAEFNYTVCDNGSPQLCSVQYTARVFVRCVNHPPTSQDFIVRTPQDTNITILIPAADVDEPDTDAVLKFQVTSFALQNKGKFYYDNVPLEEVAVYVRVGRTSGEPRAIVYVPEPGSYSTPLDAPLPLATFLFQVVDSTGATSLTHRCDVIVDFVNHPPVYLGETTVYTDENVPLNLFLLYPGIYTDDGLVLNGTVTGQITSVPTRGTFQVCEQILTNTVCKTVATTVKRGAVTMYDLDKNVYGRVVFIPDQNEFGDDYALFTLTLSDSMGLSSDWLFHINVRHVNQPPVLEPLFARPPTVNEDEYLELEWRVHDVDSLPREFTTTISTPLLQSLSRFGWSTWQCQQTGGAQSTTCTAVNRDSDTPIATREDGFPAPVVSIFYVEDTCIADYGYPFTDFSGCYASFKVIFAADPDRYGYQYTQWTFTARDGSGGSSIPLSTIIAVLPVNDPPVLTAPATVNPAAGVDDPTIVDQQGSVLVVDDPDALQISVEQLDIEVVEGDGEWVPPASARCTNVTGDFKTWECTDTIRGFNRWLDRAKFRINTAVSPLAKLRLTINDRGAVGVNNQPHLTDTKNVTIVYTPLPQVVTPPQTDNYLTLAVGIAAAAGILLLALLAWRLRKRFSAPNDDYFQVAVAPLSVAPQNPLYKAQFKEHFSPLYNPDAAK